MSKFTNYKNKGEKVTELFVSLTDEQDSGEIGEWISDCIENNDIQTFLMGIEEYGMLSRIRESVIHCLPSKFFSVSRYIDTGEFIILDTSSETEPLFSVTWQYRWFVLSQHFLPVFQFSLHSTEMEEELLVYTNSLISPKIYQVPEMITSCWKRISEIVVKHLKKHKAIHTTHEAKRKKKENHYGTGLSVEQYARVEKQLRRMFCSDTSSNDDIESVI